jgi:hypothetical protein
MLLRDGFFARRGLPVLPGLLVRLKVVLLLSVTRLLFLVGHQRAWVFLLSVNAPAVDDTRQQGRPMVAGVIFYSNTTQTCPRKEYML